MNPNGKLGAEAFEAGAKLFAERWRTLGVGEGISWNWHVSQPRLGEGHLAKGYLVLERFPVRSMEPVHGPTLASEREENEEAALKVPECVHPSEVDATICNDLTTLTGCLDDNSLKDDDNSMEDDDSSLKDELHFYDYHIVYSPSYQV
jgi:hypothetical protein